MINALKRFAKQQIVARNNYKLTGVPRINVERAAASGAPRLNIVLLALGKASLFGGADTALRLFNHLVPHYERHRIIVILEDQQKFVPAEWLGWELERDMHPSKKSVVYTRGRQSPVSIEDSDVFVATHWMTCLAVRQAMAVQSRTAVRRFLYLLQDFEPGFYPWSGRHLLAQGTYARSDDVVALFNTKELHRYFLRLGFNFPHCFVFEPSLNPSLAKYRGSLTNHRKRRLLLTYGRPGTARNAFDIAVESLEVWAQGFEDAADWDVVSLGESHRDVRLSSTVWLRSKGKVRLDEYASYLSDAAVGLSLMVYPHPSYPPLEMASFGARVITNSYAEKDLSHRSPLIRSVVETTPAGFAQALAEACRAFQADPEPLEALPPSAFLGGDEEFPFIQELLPLIG